MRQMQMQMDRRMQMESFTRAHRRASALGEPLKIPLDETSICASMPVFSTGAAVFQPSDATPTSIGKTEMHKKKKHHVEAPQGRGGDQRQGNLAAGGHVPRQARTLSTSLQVLCHEDPDCLFVVRRINKLGFHACRSLKQHFAAQGQVVRVLSAHSTVRQHGDAPGPGRRRPSSLGFVQMATAKGVQKVLALGTQHIVDGCAIIVQKFERQHDAELLEKAASFDFSLGSPKAESLDATCSTASGSSPRERAILSESG